ncbi:signal peptide peptidase SppA [Blochmannia endosymbiont of Colobopsis nipponica]|uniref:signal peptide peptidase SppA n=1 Tax=Blochmannia endosymbiont of Colobopsis nipponica TaxID=2681987 RepID=UPI0017804936|nr:signal peptide peptidase SppA [Blochmannia endosymbiont of Colobopsis nipponica]
MKKIWKIIYNLCSQSWCILTFIRELIMNLIFLLIIITTISIYLCMRQSTIKHTTKSGALIIDLTGIIVDKVTVNNKFNQIGRELIGIPKNKIQENSLFDLIIAIRHAKNDPNITGLILSLKNFRGTDQASLQYIGKVLHEFRNHGKPIYAIGDHYTQSQYFLASYANKIYLSPHGAVDLHGISTNKFYYKELLDKLKINIHIFRVGTYKSAVEPFLRNNMSDEARFAETCWVEKLWQNYLTIVADNRKITKQQLFPNIKIILSQLQNMHGDTALYALKNKLIDEIASNEVIEKTMIKNFGFDKKNNSFNNVSIYDYQIPSPQQKKDKIAVIFANGTIIDESNLAGTVNSDNIINKIRDARLNNEIKAIIFRINSPGGSVHAAELISEELLLAKKSGKPIIVSMGGIAASGGYWISTPANAIIASSSTLTGSIGTFGIISTFENLLDDAGIHTDGIFTSPLADVSISRKLPHEYIKMVQLCINKSYENFIDTVAKFRHKSPQEIDQIAQGRVWIGTDAIEKGLVDNLGDFDDAVIKAAELANIKEYKLTWYLEESNLFDIMLAQVDGSLSRKIFNFLKFLYSINANQTNFLFPFTNYDSEIRKNNPYDNYTICFSSYQI